MIKNDIQEVSMQSIPYSGAQTQVRINTFIRSVYNWMGIALALTGFTAYYVANSPQMLNLLFNIAGNRLQPSMLFWGCLIAELVMVFTLSARVQKMKAQTATGPIYSLFGFEWRHPFIDFYRLHTFFYHSGLFYLRTHLRGYQSVWLFYQKRFDLHGPVHVYGINRHRDCFGGQLFL